MLEVTSARSRPSDVVGYTTCGNVFFPMSTVTFHTRELNAKHKQVLISNISEKYLEPYLLLNPFRTKIKFGGKALKCTSCGTCNVNYSVADYLVTQGAPIRCKKCRSTCWICGNQHVCGHNRPGNYDMCDGCRVGIIIDRAESTEKELSLGLANAIQSELRQHGPRAYLYRCDHMLWPGGEQAVKLVELMLKKCKDGPSRIDGAVGVNPKLVNMLKERGVPEDAIRSMRSRCSALSTSP